MTQTKEEVLSRGYVIKYGNPEADEVTYGNTSVFCEYHEFTDTLHVRFGNMGHEDGKNISLTENLRLVSSEHDDGIFGLELHNIKKQRLAPPNNGERCDAYLKRIEGDTFSALNIPPIIWEALQGMEILFIPSFKKVLP